MQIELYFDLHAEIVETCSSGTYRFSLFCFSASSASQLF